MIMIGIALVCGVLTWSLTEYWVHRVLGHNKHLKGKNLFGKEHTAHHGQGDYFAAWYKKAAAALVVVGLTGPPAVLAAGPAIGLAWVAGFAGFYLVYEVLHRLEHVWQGFGFYGRWARHHHFYHHFHDASMNHGVTSPIWDLVFGTYVRPDIIAVPKKLVMPWLCDESGDVHPHLRRLYAVRKRRAA